MSRPPQRPATAAPRKPNSKSNAVSPPQAKGQLHPVDGMAEMDAVGRQVAGIMDGLKG